MQRAGDGIYKSNCERGRAVDNSAGDGYPTRAHTCKRGLTNCARSHCCVQHGNRLAVSFECN